MAIFKSMFKKTSYINLDSGSESEEKDGTGTKQPKEPSVPEGLWVKCPKCGKMIYRDDIRENFYACPKCGGYFRIKTRTRIRLVLDKGSFEEWGTDIPDKNPLDFPQYEEKLENTREKTGLREAITIGKGSICGQETVFGVCDARFLMGSMGYAVGERITRAVERATKERLPVILFCCSGGARMQEGIVSLMQMAKTSAALKRHSEAGLLYVPVLTDPTTGGVTASFAMLGDIILAEPGALIGFAGPRVISQTIGEKLPEGFQRAEFLVEKGIIDGIVERKNLRNTLSALLAMHKTEVSGREFGRMYDFEDAVRSVQAEQTDREVTKRSAWERVKLSRSQSRCTARDYIEAVFDDFLELHGDRAFRDDGAIVGGVATLDGMPVTVIGQQKGRSTKENISCNFGMVSPEGYRKALRLMKQAEKFHRPIVCFVDTPGAACGIGAEERGQGEAIARNLYEMSDLKVPVLSIVIGEGGSGGALGLAVANEVWMMENATYSILSPEGFASILWKDGKRAKEASGIMKITAEDLKELGVIEWIVPEKEPAESKNLKEIAENMKLHMKDFFYRQAGKTGEELALERYERFRVM